MSDEIASNEEWLRWGKTDPLYGVASWRGKEKGGAHPWTDDEFFAIGASDFADFARIWRQYRLVPESCAEIGCGAGRMTRQLVESFGTVHAIDISPDIIEYAKSRVRSASVRWHTSNGVILPLEDRSVTAAFSTHVFQHLASVADGIRYFVEIARVLKPGGSLMVHLPIHRHPPLHPRLASASRVLHEAYFALYSAKAWFLRRRMRHGGPLYMHGMSYDEQTLFSALTDLGFLNIEFVTFALTSNGALHTCVLATR